MWVRVPPGLLILYIMHLDISIFRVTIQSRSLIGEAPACEAGR